jgi:hypothetical protein
MAEHGQQLAVRPDALQRHACSVRAAADGAGEARAAAATVRLGGEAYGQLLYWLPMLIDWLQDRVIEAMDGALEVLDISATALEQTANGYDNTDFDAADGYRSVRA